MSLYPLVALSVVVLASTTMFLWNVRRSTHQRPVLELHQFARNHDLTLDARAPTIVQTLLPTFTPHTSLGHSTLTLIRLRDRQPGGAPLHLLVLPLQFDWPATALLPVKVLSLLQPLLPTLRPYPSLPGTDRFTTRSTSLQAAKTLANSPIRTLLPPDLALLLHGPHLLLDFSARPFDPLEFARLLPLATQLANHLPPGVGQ